MDSAGKLNTVVTIVGLQWGDEGKGKIVDWLAAKTRHVARFQGGHNAGHSLVHQGKKTVLHLLPSGVLQPQTLCYIGSGVVISLTALLKELQDIQQSDIVLKDRLFIADSAALVLPYHQRLDCARDRKNKIGTTGLGIGPAYEDKVGRRALHLYDLYNGAGWERLQENVSFYNYLLARHDEQGLDAAELWENLLRQVETVRPYLCDDIGCRLTQAAARRESVLLEGAQGALLDVEQGTYPYTTAAPCIAASADAGLGAALFSRVVGISKCYCTRVGNGPFPTEITDAVGAELAARGNEFGSTTGRARRVGWLDIPLLRHTIRVNGCRQIIITKLDIFDEQPEIKICTAYDLDGERRDLPPSDAVRLKRCRPVYETLPGWRGQKSANVTDMNQLPAAAENYIKRVEELTGIPVMAISTGAERDTTICRQPLF